MRGVVRVEMALHLLLYKRSFKRGGWNPLRHVASA